MAQAEHGDDSPLWCLSPDAGLLDAVAGAVERLAPERPSVRDAELQLVDTDDVRAAVRIAEEIAPEHLELVGADAEALADRVRRAGCVFVGTGAGTAFGDYVAGLEPRAAHRRGRSLPVGALPGHLPAPDGSRILARRGGGPPRARRRRTGPRRGLSRARRVDGAPGVSRSAEIHRTTNETDVELRLDLDGAGAGSRDHRASASSTTCSTRWPATAASTSTSGWRATSTPARTTPWRTPGLALGQALDEALGDRAGIRRFGHAVIPMDEARASCAIDISGRPFLRLRGRATRTRAWPTSTPTWPRSSSARWRAPPSSRCTCAWRPGANSHHMVEASFKAFARALRVAVADDPDETGVPSTKGVL